MGWPGASRVITTLAKRRASALIGAMISSPGDGKAAAGEEVILHVDDDQGVVGTRKHQRLLRGRG